MKLKLLSLYIVLATIITACNDEAPAMKIEQETAEAVACEGSYREVKLTTVGQWTAQSDSPWCKIVNAEGQDYSTLVVNVLGNTTHKARTAQVTITTDRGSQSFTIDQKALPEGEQLTYRLPVVFHVLYFDADNKQENPDADTFYRLLDQVNDLYKQAGEGSPDMKVEFYPAPYGPDGIKLDEPGIERVEWMTPSINATEFMHDATRKYVHLMWEPTDYVNIFLYRFQETGTLGISTFPVVPKSHSLLGLDEVEDYDYSLFDLASVRGVSLNNYFVNDSHEAFADYVPKEWADIFNLQNALHITLAHELGHYLGLYHSFWYDPMGLFCQDTDYCEDTESYDRMKYQDAYLEQYYGIIDGSIDPANFNWASLFNRQDCSKQPFESHNLMDYNYGYLDEWTQAQYDRVRHVLTYSPLIPGAKVKDEIPTRTAPVSVELPLRVSDGKPATGHAIHRSSSHQDKK